MGDLGGDGDEEIEDGLRLVFAWDRAIGEEGQGWKFHDAGLMPFPPHGHKSLEEAVKRADGYGTDMGMAEVKQNGNVNGMEEEGDDDDDYWNSYGGAEDDDDHDAIQAHNNSASKEGSDAGGEDAYWARYASVQGSHHIYHTISIYISPLCMY